MRCAAQHVESRALARRCRAEAGETGHGRQARHTAQIDHRCRHAAPAAPTAAAAAAAPAAAAAASPSAAAFASPSAASAAPSARPAVARQAAAMASLSFGSNPNQALTLSLTPTLTRHQV